jgi:hypothetical protein
LPVDPGSKVVVLDPVTTQTQLSTQFIEGDPDGRQVNHV